jgi:phage shock protein E
MKKILFLTFFLFSGFIGFSQTLKTLAINDFIKTYSITKKKTMLDVRTPEEWAAGTVKGATLLSIKDPSFLKEIEKLAKENPVFIYCAAGVRAGNAGRKLKSLGFNQVYVLGSAGYKELSAKGL